MIKFNIQTEDLKHIISALRPATAKADYAHPADEYIKFECTDGKLTTYATDGLPYPFRYRAYRYYGSKNVFCFSLEAFYGTKN